MVSKAAEVLDGQFKDLEKEISNNEIHVIFLFVERGFNAETFVAPVDNDVNVDASSHGERRQCNFRTKCPI
jgi:hypothetical protein